MNIPTNDRGAHPAGSSTPIRLWGVPVYVHWSFLLGGLLISMVAGGGIYLFMYCSMAYGLLILIHELGHAFAAKVMRLRVHAIHIYGLGGRCTADPPHSVKGAFFLYSSGLLAQLLLFMGTALYIATCGWPKSTYYICLVNTFTMVNLIIFVCNLFPGRTSAHVFTDGEILWKLTMHTLNHEPYPLMRNPAGASPVFPPETSLLSVPGITPAGFRVGLEVLNDDRTPMDFVVATFKKHLGLDDREATKLMLEIHKMGGVLLPQPNIDEARQVADAIAEFCQVHAQPLVCRAVEVL